METEKDKSGSSGKGEKSDSQQGVRDGGLEKTHAADLSLLEDLRKENEARRRSEDALRESERMYRALVDVLPDVVTRFDRECKCLFVSDSVEKELGLSPGQLVGKMPWEIGFPEEKSRFFEESVRRVFEKGEPCETEFDLVTLHGPNSYNWRLMPEKDEEGAVKSVITILRNITGRKKAEEAIRESQSRLSAALASMTDAVFISDVNGHFVEFNDAFAAFHRFKSREECARDLNDYPGILDVFMADGDPAPLEMWAVPRALRGETAMNEEYTLRRKDTGETWIGSYSFSPIRDKGGAIVGTVVVGRDVTERKKAEMRIRRNQGHLRSLVEILQYRAGSIQEFLDKALEEAIGITESKIGYIYFYSEGTRRFTLNTWSKDVMGECAVINPQTCYELDSTGVWGEAVRQRRPIIMNDFQASNPLKKGYPQGHVVLHKFMTVPIFKGGEIIAVVGVANKRDDYDEEDVVQLRLLMEAVWKSVDIKKGEAELREAEERFQQLFDHMADGVAVYQEVSGGDDFIIVDMNSTGQSLTGVSLGDVVGRRVTEIYPGVMPMGLLDVFRRVWKTGTPESFPLREYSDSRLKMWVENYVYRLPSGLVVSIFSDTSEKHRAEEERIRLEAQLRQSQKMEAVGQLAGGISHDFNNLLSVINGYSQMLLNSPELKSADRQKVEGILRAGELASSLTRQLLVFSRRQQMEPKIIDLNTIVAGMNKMLGRIIRENIGFEMIEGPGLWSIKADPGQIEQVIMNLVLNARDAMPDGGKLTIKTGNAVVDSDDDFARTAEIKPGSYVVLSVSDTGHGMDEKVREHMFEPFFTTKEIGKGTGLGLAIVYGIVKQCEAFIDVRSEPDKGAAFSIYFPKSSDAGTEGNAVAGLPYLQGGNETILLVEDDAPIRELLQEFIGSLGYKVLVCGRAEDAIRLAMEYEGRINLLLSDIVMPGMNGFELAKKLKGLFPEVKLLFMTGYVKPTETHGMLRKGGNLIEKPISVHALGKRIREVLDK